MNDFLQVSRHQGAWNCKMLWLYVHPKLKPRPLSYCAGPLRSTLSSILKFQKEAYSSYRIIRGREKTISNRSGPFFNQENPIRECTDSRRKRNISDEKIYFQREYFIEENQEFDILY